MNLVEKSKNKQETIVAIATPPGQGGIGIVRLSGPEAYRVACAISKKKRLIPRKMYYCSFYDSSDHSIDQGMLVYFKGPYSFTGEDVVEFQMHGSPILLNQLLTISCHFGARLAEPGEFSLRAYLNDKIDLAQAEAIADLISARSQSAAKLALRSLKGDFSKQVNALSEAIIFLRSYVEASIDFSDEDISFLEQGRVFFKIEELIRQTEQLIQASSQGARLREGGIIVIAGRPNVGKSTLLNAITGENIAIVTDIPGTTRDIMKETVLINDFPFQLIDTAGLRQTDDVVEQEGIKRAWNAIKNADIVLLLSDVLNQEDVSLLSESIIEALPDKAKMIHIINKIDLIDKEPSLEGHKVFLSAKNEQGMTLLKQKILEDISYTPDESIFFARQRHLDALKETLHFLNQGKIQLVDYVALELFAQDLRFAHESLCRILGKYSSNDLLGAIFSKFCIGK